MALQIKSNPVLTGKDAERFIDQMEKNKNKKIDKSKLLKMIDLFKTICENSKK